MRPYVDGKMLRLSDPIIVVLANVAHLLVPLRCPSLRVPETISPSGKKLSTRYPQGCLNAYKLIFKVEL